MFLSSLHKECTKSSSHITYVHTSTKIYTIYAHKYTEAIDSFYAIIFWGPRYKEGTASGILNQAGFGGLLK